MMSHPHHAKVTPKFSKQYSSVGKVIQEALINYREEVTEGSFPSSKFSPYKISEGEVKSLSVELRARGLGEVADAMEEDAHRERLEKQTNAI